MKGSMFITHKSGLKIKISWLARVVGVVWAGLIYKGVGCGLLHAANLNKPHLCTNTIFSFRWSIVRQSIEGKRERVKSFSKTLVTRGTATYVCTYTYMGGSVFVRRISWLTWPGGGGRTLHKMTAVSNRVVRGNPGSVTSYCQAPTQLVG